MSKLAKNKLDTGQNMSREISMSKLARKHAGYRSKHVENPLHVKSQNETCWIPVKTCREFSPCQKSKRNMLDTGQKLLVKTKHAGYRSKVTGQNETCWILVKRYWSKQNT